MAKATEINCPKCHAQVHMRFAGKDGIQCKRCYYWISRDIMLKLISEQEGEAVVIQPEPEEEESFVVCAKCHHKTFYSKIMDGGVMCKKCYNWIVVEEESEIPPIIEEAIMHRQTPSHTHVSEVKHQSHETPASPAKHKEHPPEFAISGGSYIAGKSIEDIPIKAEKIAIVGKDALPAEEGHDWFRHKTTSPETSVLEDNKPAEATEKSTKDSWYISQEDLAINKITEPAEEKEEKTPEPEVHHSEKAKNKRYKPRRKDLTHIEGGKRKIKAKSPGKESRVFKKATKKLVTRRKHEKESESETPIKEVPVEVAEDTPAIVTPAPEIKEEPIIEIEAAIEKIDELLEKTERVLTRSTPEVKKPEVRKPETAITEKAEEITEKPIREESAAVSSEPVLAMPAPVVKEEKVDTDTVELPIPIPIKEKAKKTKYVSDDFETTILKEPPLELPPPPEKIAKSIVVEEKAIPMGSGEEAFPVPDETELDEAFIAAYLPKKYSSDVHPVQENILPEVPEEEIIALMPEMDMADEDILDFLVEPPDFEIPGMDAIKGGASYNEAKGNSTGSSLTDSTTMQIQQPEIVVRQIPASMRPKMTSMLSKPSKREDLDLPQKTDFSTTKLPSKPPTGEIAANNPSSVKSQAFPAKPAVHVHKPTEPAPISKAVSHPTTPPFSDKPDADSVKSASPPAISVRMRTPEIKKHSLPVPSTAHKGASNPPVKTPAAQHNVPQKPLIPTVPAKPAITGPGISKPAVSGSHPVFPNTPMIKKERPDAGKTPPEAVIHEKPKAAGLPAPPILNRKMFAPKKIDISSVFKKKQ